MVSADQVRTPEVLLLLLSHERSALDSGGGGGGGGGSGSSGPGQAMTPLRAGTGRAALHGAAAGTHVVFVGFVIDNTVEAAAEMWRRPWGAVGRRDNGRVGLDDGSLNGHNFFPPQKSCMKLEWARW